MAGLRKVWRTNELADSTSVNVSFSPQKIDDGLLEFVCYKTELNLALERLLPSGAKAMQGNGPF